MDVGVRWLAHACAGLLDISGVCWSRPDRERHARRPSTSNDNPPLALQRLCPSSTCANVAPAPAGWLVGRQLRTCRSRVSSTLAVPERVQPAHAGAGLKPQTLSYPHARAGAGAVGHVLGGGAGGRGGADAPPAARPARARQRLAAGRAAVLRACSGHAARLLPSAAAGRRPQPRNLARSMTRGRAPGAWTAGDASRACTVRRRSACAQRRRRWRGLSAPARARRGGERACAAGGQGGRVRGAGRPAELHAGGALLRAPA